MMQRIHKVALPNDQYRLCSQHSRPWVQWAMGAVGPGCGGPWVQWAMGAVGHGRGGPWVQWALGAVGPGCGGPWAQWPVRPMRGWHFASREVGVNTFKNNDQVALQWAHPLS